MTTTPATETTARRALDSVTRLTCAATIAATDTPDATPDAVAALADATRSPLTVAGPARSMLITRSIILERLHRDGVAQDVIQAAIDKGIRQAVEDTAEGDAAEGDALEASDDGKSPVWGVAMASTFHTLPDQASS